MMRDHKRAAQGAHQATIRHRKAGEVLHLARFLLYLYQAFSLRGCNRSLGPVFILGLSLDSSS